ncbi:MAG TPA: hypothetical protein VMW52_11000, partial [Phycisphaerae bacterium]|nr:hypothetical protein [Phycisphaerae bacterium]
MTPKQTRVLSLMAGLDIAIEQHEEDVDYTKRVYPNYWLPIPTDHGPDLEFVRGDVVAKLIAWGWVTEPDVDGELHLTPRGRSMVTEAAIDKAVGSKA